MLNGSDGGIGAGAGSGAFGLETERMCEIVVDGTAAAVELAKVRLLVMLDQLVSLCVSDLRLVTRADLTLARSYSLDCTPTYVCLSIRPSSVFQALTVHHRSITQVCEIDHKLHPIIASRKRCVIQTIQEETGTNIYFPSPLSGFVPPFPHPHDAHQPHQQMGFSYHQPQMPYQQHRNTYPHQQQHHQQQNGLHPSQHAHHPHNQGYLPQPHYHNGGYANGGGQNGYNGGGPGPGVPGGDLGGPRNPLNAIWITGEFFGVQRAKDMLFQVSMHKVRVSGTLFAAFDLLRRVDRRPFCPPHADSAFPSHPSEQVHYLSRYLYSPSQARLASHRATRRSEDDHERQRNLRVS